VIWRDYVEPASPIALANHIALAYPAGVMKPLSTLLAAIISFAFGALLPHSVQAESRTWTQASSGRTIEGEFVKVEGDNVHIRKADGGIIPVPLTVLTEDDQKFVASHAKAAEPTTSPSTPAKEGDPGEPSDAEPIVLELHEIHLRCSACERGIEEAVAGIEGVTVTADKGDALVTLNAPSKKVAQQAVDAIAAAGYYGKSDSHDVDFKGAGVKDEKAKMVTVTGLPLCCKGCVTAADKAITAVDGVEDHTAKSKADSFEITGDFSPSEVLRNLRKAGMNAVITVGAVDKDADDKK